MNRIRSWALGAAATVPCLVACGPTEDASRWVVSDSAGIEIVTNTGPAPVWVVSPGPSLSLGVVDQGGPTEFFRVTDIELFGDGGFAVANAGSEEVRFFGAQGEFLGSAGGRGYGPAEFRGLELLDSFADSLLTYDAGNDRVSVRSLDGTFRRSFRLEWFNGLLGPVDFLDDGGVLAVTARYMSELSGTGLVVDTALVSRYDNAGNLLDSIVRLPHNERVVRREGDMQTTLSAPYSAHAQIVGVDGGFCYAFGPIPEIRCFNEAGAPDRIVRAPLTIRLVSEDDISRFWDEQLATTVGVRLDALRRLKDMMPFPDAFPTFSQLESDDVGRVWARVYALPEVEQEQWLVFEDGRLVGEMLSPPGLRVMDVRRNRIAGVWTDDLGVEFVRVYEFGVA